MAENEEKSIEEKQQEPEIGLVRISLDTGIGMKLPDGNVIDLSAIDLGQAQVFEYIVKTLADIRKNIG